MIRVNTSIRTGIRVEGKLLDAIAVIINAGFESEAIELLNKSRALKAREREEQYMELHAEIEALRKIANGNKGTNTRKELVNLINNLTA